MNRRPQPLGELLAPWWNRYNTRQENPMRKYRKKPVVIEAVQFDGSNHAELSEFTNGRFCTVTVDDRNDDPVITAQVFDVLHSTWVGVKDGQWIIRGVAGEFYPCDVDVFAATYEPVTEDGAA